MSRRVICMLDRYTNYLFFFFLEGVISWEWAIRVWQVFRNISGRYGHIWNGSLKELITNRGWWGRGKQKTWMKMAFFFFFEMVYDIMGLAGIAESLCCCKLKWFWSCSSQPFNNLCQKKKLLSDNKLSGMLLSHLIQLFDEFHALITYNHKRLCIHQRNSFLMYMFIFLVDFIMLVFSFCCHLHFIQGVHLSNLFPHRMPFRKITES